MERDMQELFKRLRVVQKGAVATVSRHDADRLKLIVAAVYKRANEKENKKWKE